MGFPALSRSWIPPLPFPPCPASPGASLCHAERKERSFCRQLHKTPPVLPSNYCMVTPSVSPDGSEDDTEERSHSVHQHEEMCFESRKAPKRFIPVSFAHVALCCSVWQTLTCRHTPELRLKPPRQTLAIHHSATPRSNVKVKYSNKERLTPGSLKTNEMYSKYKCPRCYRL